MNPLKIDHKIGYGLLGKFDSKIDVTLGAFNLEINGGYRFHLIQELK